MKTPSRAEIEQLARSKPKEAIHPPKTNNVKDTSQQARRSSNILGGNLYGIKKKKYKSSNIGWIAAIGFVLLSGLIFIIPAFTEKNPKFSTETKKTPINSIYQDSLIIEEKETANFNKNTFTLAEDKKRADNFRQNEINEKEIESFKRSAKIALEKGRYTQPEEQSAHYYFQQILKIDNNNSYAKRGTKYLINRLFALGLQQVEDTNLQSSRKSLAALFLINENSIEYNELLILVTDLEIKQNKIADLNEIKSLLVKAEKAVKKKRYTTPSSDNAYSYYSTILQKDDTNIDATQGINNIYAYYKDSLSQKLKSEDWEKAEKIIDSLNSVKFKQVFINDLANDILIAKKLKKEKEKKKKLALKNKKELEKEEARIKQKKAELQLAIINEQKALELENKKLIELAKAREEQSKIDQLNRQKALVRSNNSINTANPQAVTVKNVNTKGSQNGAPVSEIGNIQSEKSRLTTGLEAYYNGEYVTAFSNLAALAERGNSRAQIRIGYMYQFGRGVQKNEAVGQSYLRAALPSLRKNANQDYAWAQADLGSLYEDGIILTKSYTEALTWYRRAASKNYTGAQTNLGNMYFFGKGVQKNKAEAIRWYRIAAAGGDAIAKQNLIQLRAIPIN